MVDHVDHHLAETLSLAHLASVAALSPFHFLRSSQNTMGCSPHRYVALRRLERARDLISGGASPSFAASALGFKSLRRLRGAFTGGFGQRLS